MGELGLLAEDFACATESAAPEIIGIIATKRLEASRLRLQSDLEAAGELKASQALQDVCLSETNVWRPEIGLAESALRRKDGTGHAAFQWSLAALAALPRGAFSIRLDRPTWSFFEGFLLPVAGDARVTLEDQKLWIESDCASFEFEQLSYGWKMQRRKGAGPAWDVSQVGQSGPGYITKTSLKNAINGFPWPKFDEDGSTPAPIQSMDEEVRAIGSAREAILQAGDDFDAWIGNAFCGYMLMSGGGLNTAHANSSNDFPGLLALQPPSDPVHCAELIVYEASRQYASAFMMVAPLIQEGKEAAFYSPLKRSYETMGRMILGTHAVGNLLIFYANLSRSRALDEASRDRFDIHKLSLIHI